jgi:hypothetical protein
MNAGRCADVTAGLAVVNSWENAGAVAEPRRQDQVVITLAGLDDGTADPFSACPSSFQRINRCLTVDVDRIEADASPQADIGLRARLPP